MREIDDFRITLLRLFRGAVRLPDEIIDEIWKAFLHTRNAAIKVQAITKGYLVRFNPYDYMDQGAAKAFSYNVADPGHILGRVGLKPSMYHRNYNMNMALWRYRDESTERRIKRWIQRRIQGWEPMQ